MPTIILDRDGVINHDSDGYIKSASEWVAIDGTPEAIARLNRAGYRVAVATNQSGLGRGLFTLETLTDIHRKMIDAIEGAGGYIDIIVFCPHHPEDNCECRKPKPGLLHLINQEIPLNPDTDWMVGDTVKDLAVAQRMEIRAVLVETGKGQRELSSGLVSRETSPVFADLPGFVNWLLD
jgi:D-glycero-D-manno-heptose 1,7-bisphosphate phosphatase